MSGLISTWLIGSGAALVLVILVWLASLVRRDAGIIDIFWGAGFVLLAWVYFALADGSNTRGRLTLALVSLWGLRLSLHILRRSRGKGEDYRYAEMRQKHGKRFAWVSLFKVFLLQGALMALISTPLLQAIRSPVPERLVWLDLTAAAVFGVGFLFEAIGDLQLTRFRDDPANQGKVLCHGLWRFTRHPNYFGDAVVWWSFFLLALATPAGIWTVYSPIVMTALLLKVSGVSLLEQKLKRTRPEYADYVARTNAFVPWFPKPPSRRVQP